MVKTKKRMSEKPTCCYTATFGYTESVARKCCSSQVSTLNEHTLPAAREAKKKRWLWYGMERSTTWITEGDTAQTERMLTRLVIAHSWIAVCLYQEQKSVCTSHPCIDVVTSGVVFPCCTHNSRIQQHAHFAHSSGARLWSYVSGATLAELHWLLQVDPRQLVTVILPTEYHATTMRIRWNLAD